MSDDCAQPDLVHHSHELPDPELVAEGWERRYLADPERAREAMELYPALGFEVKAHPVRVEDFHDDCGDCRSVLCRTYVVIYTRRPPR